MLVGLLVQKGPYEVAVVESEFQLKLKSSIAVVGLTAPPPPVIEGVLVTILIQIGPELLFNTVPKFTVIVVVPHAVLFPVTTEAGEVVAFVNEAGELPNP